ncbi:MAG TPA: M2 family metallopeptidase [Planctomycetota bacterium]|nr:M2 family metallopeptidase [Planctomycetota bacterium]
MIRHLFTTAFLLPLATCKGTVSNIQVGDAPKPNVDAPSAAAFLETYSETYRDLYTATQEAEWIAATDVSDEHTAEQVGANKVKAAFTGGARVIERARDLMKSPGKLEPLQVRQLDKVLLLAAENPNTVPEIVKRRIEAEGRQRQTLDGFVFKMEDGHGGTREVTPNDIEDVLRKSTDLEERRRAWEASKTSGVALRDGLVELRDLRNQVAKAMGHDSFFALQVADYGLKTPQMMATMERSLADVRPLYEQLHAWAKRKLAAKFGQPVPKRIPAHWLGNRWGQEWPGLADAVDLDPLFKDKKPRDIVETAQDFYSSMGFPDLPKSFWELSDLYELPAGSKKKKNTHASAWHMNLETDVRSLMSVKPDFEWFLTAHHELGHIHYYLAYSKPGVPLLLRDGADRAFHEAIGELIALAAAQQPYLRDLGVLGADTKIDPIAWQLSEALKSVVFLPFAAGTMTFFEHDLYEEPLAASKLNERWWRYVARFQGIEPPGPRGETFCDAATKTHINDDPAQYYDYALATLIKFQLHDHIARKILHQDPRSVSYRGSKQVGDFLRSILAQGATKPGYQIIREATGEDLSGRAMLEYFAPLREWLEKENAGKDTSF